MSSPATAVTDEKTSNRKYPYPPTGEMWWSVTTALGGTEDKPYLVPWASKITGYWMFEHWSYIAAVRKTLGLREAMKQAMAESERIRGVKRDAGGYVHDVAEALVYWAAAGGEGKYIPLPDLPAQLRGVLYDEMPVDQVVDMMIGGWVNFVADFKPLFLAAEMTVYHPGLKVAGTLDCIVWLPGLAIGPGGRFIPGDGVAVCIDIKTGKHLSVTWVEQIAIYRRCPQCLVGPDELADTPASKAGAVLHLRPPFEIQVKMVNGRQVEVIVPNPGYERGYRLMLISGADDEAAAERGRNAIGIFQGRMAARDKPGKVVYPLRADGTVPQPRLADLDGEGYGRLLSPLAKAGIEDLEQLAAMKSGDLLHTRGIKDKTLNGIRVMLADHGLHLADEPASGGCGYCRAGLPGRCAGPSACAGTRKAAA